MPVKRKRAPRRPRDGAHSGPVDGPVDGNVDQRAGDRDEHDDLSPTSARGYEAFGRVMAALATEADFIESCRDLTWWRGADHGWHIEWRDGPYASEVAALLSGHVRASDGPLVTEKGQGSAGSAVLDVMGVRFELRAIDPMGRAALRARAGFWRLSEALDTTRRTNTRHPWEELLGG
ncbi:hypothetical protein FE391_02530 [Nonomuraea sp. KC401]|uniref:hypothetical protein n=1 Tax=unclassified Nonomuraea TaxID=2593643 RepID=UPI0010FE7DDF|nr:MULTISPECIES: hypothetical protein [unclassified Nonomuraea]NBE92104.1 hypothetical protein [Nonomuraea sp. K271]TLF85097.1 hypothetical protein FE391_02530 [Nonomuraea sp. KC401]